MVYEWSKKLQSALLPTTCRLCLAPGQPGLELCRDCLRDLPWLTHGCAGCALPLPPETSVSLCPSCQKKPPALDRCRALFVYQAPVDGWIQGLKFNQDLAAARLLGRLLADSAPPCAETGLLTLLPVPLHRQRLRQRGYNQALEIARPLVRNGYQLDPRCCRRHRATAAQSSLPARSRKGNLRNAFSLTRPVEGHRFLLIDDVITTGATLAELARVLKKAGAARVEAWVIARTVKEKGTGD